MSTKSTPLHWAQQATKAIKRHFRDASLAARTFRIRLLVILLALGSACLLPFWVASTLLSNVPFRPSPCGCPADTDDLQKLVKRAESVLVARAAAHGALHPLAVLRGALRGVSHPVHIPAYACGGVHAGDMVLVLSGRLQRGDGDISTPATPLLDCAAALVLPWAVWRDAMPRLAIEGEESGATWWRMRDTQWSWNSGTRNASEWWVRSGVSIVAACMDRPDTLRQAARSWFATHGVDEVVLIDWSSRPPAMESLDAHDRMDTRLVVARVEGETQWTLSRAYNLGISLTTYSKVLKVDCDTRLHPEFITRHALRHGEFYAGDWRALRSPEDEKLHINGLLFAGRGDLLEAGGYDERITTYGWDDSDVTERLAGVLDIRRFDYSQVAHIKHPAALRVSRQGRRSLLPIAHPLAAAVEIQRNRLLLTRFNLPAWSASSKRTVWNVETRHAAHAVAGAGVFGYASEVRAVQAQVFVATAANNLASATELVSEADGIDVAKRAIRVVLHRFNVPVLPKSLSLSFYKNLCTQIAYPHRFPEIAIELRGGCWARLLAYSAAMSSETPKNGWRLRMLWRTPSDECGCGFYDSFDAINAEITASWSHTRTVATPVSNDARELFSSFDTHAVRKLVNASVKAWRSSITHNNTISRVLVTQLSCDVHPTHATPAHIQAIRAALRNLTLNENTQTLVRTSLRQPTLFDDPSHWRTLLGAPQWQDPKLHRMAATWAGPASAAHLLARAARLAAHAPTAARHLFKGCPAPASIYLETYPELAIVSAALERCSTTAPRVRLHRNAQ